MTFRPKIWTGLGLGVAMVGLAACGGESGESGAHGEAGESAIERVASEAGESGEVGEHGEAGESGEAGEQSESGEAGEQGEAGESGESGDAGHSDALPLPKRLAFMSGHVEAGLALYRAGEPEMAASHLLHPVSETHASEREGIEALGFEKALFETVSAALDVGKPASEIEPQLRAAEANLKAVTQQAGGDTAEIIKFLMETLVEEYTIGVPNDKIEVEDEYQDAYGFAVVALARAEAIEGDAGARVRAELETLLGLWQGAPVPLETPATAGAVSAQVGLVLLELP